MDIKQIEISVNKHETLILRDALTVFLNGRENCPDNKEIKELTDQFKKLVFKFND